MTKNPLWITAGVLAVLAVVVFLLPRHPAGLRPTGTTAPAVPTASSQPTAPIAANIPTDSAPGNPAAAAGQPVVAGNPSVRGATPVSVVGTTTQPNAARSTGVTAEVSAAQATMIDLDLTRRSIRDYRTLMGENPVGTNAEIMKALMGGNPRQATLGPAEGQRLNAKGELVDQWGTPYFFHQLSGTQMEIYSAGPDKILGTVDDIILK